MGKLFLIPSNLAPDTSVEVIPSQTKEAITSVDLFLVEEIRTARRYISSLKLGLTIEDLRFEKLNKGTRKEHISAYFKEFKGKTIGVISEAGCPGIADPGALAAEIAHERNWTVVPLVGPSSITLALMASGMNGQSFAFQGYLPIDRGKRVQQIKLLESTSRQLNQTQIFIETPFRNNHMFEDLCKHCHPQTRLCIATDITAPTAFIHTKTIGEWKSEKIDLHKRPTIFLIHSYK